MAEEAVALEEVEEETSVLDILATQNEEVDDELEVKAEEESDDVEVLKKRLKDRNFSLKLAKQANTRLLDEQKDYNARFDELEKKLSQPAPVDVGANKQEQTEALEKWRAEISDNPEKAVDFSNLQMSQLQESVVGVVTSMKQSFDEQIAELKGATNPERIKYKGQMDKLRASNPDFAGLDDQTLMAVVKATSGVKIPRGSPSGQKPAKTLSTDDQLDELRQKFKASFENGN